MTAYAEIVGGATATEIISGQPFTLSTGQQLAANWLSLNSQAQREALNIYPITDDADPGIAYIVTGSTLQVGGGGVTVQRHWTTTAKTAGQLQTEMRAEVDARQAYFAYDDIEVPLGSGDLHNLYRANAVDLIALAMHASFAAEALANGHTANDADGWCPDGAGGTLATMYWPNIYDEDYTKGPGEIRDMQAAFAGYLRRLVKTHTRYYHELSVANAANDIPAMLAIRDEYLTDAPWLVDYP